MSKTASYQIIINGIQESVDAVESLNKQLEALESRINALNKKSVSVGTGKSSSGGGKSALSEEDKLLRQINQMEEKRAATQTQIYQSMLAEKDLLKEATQDAKQLAAAERLQADTYSNTMQGMKQQLADIKAVMQTVDLGDTAEFDRLTAKANELNSKLKEIEQSYGQFGRNVGNYANGVVEGLSRVTIKVGETERTFASAREASRTLNNELKAMALNGQQNTAEYHELNEAVKQVNSTLNDVSKSSVAMDNLLDTMQGFTALGSISTGLSSFFGFDNDEIQQSIQKMVALQNVLQGIEQINLQMQTQEGVGKWLSKGNKAIDDFTNKLFGAKKATDEMAKAQEVAGQAAEGASAALKETAVAETAVATGAKTASVAAKALSVTLKTLGIGLVVAGIAAAVEGIQKLVGLITDWVKGDADLISAEQLLNTEIEISNRNLERRLRLNEERFKSGEISGTEKAIEDERAYGDALNETKNSLEDLTKEIEDFGVIRAGDKGVTYLGGFDEGIKSFDDLIKRYELLSDAAKKGKGVMTDYIEGMGDLSLTADDVKDELAHIEKMVGGNIVSAMMKLDTSTEQGRIALIKFVNNWEQNGSKLEKSALLNIPELLSKKYPELAKVLEQYLNGVFDFVDRANASISNLGNVSLSIATTRGGAYIKLKADMDAVKTEWEQIQSAFKKGLITREEFEKKTKIVVAAYKRLGQDAREEVEKNNKSIAVTSVKGTKDIGTKVTRQIQDNGKKVTRQIDDNRKKEAEAVKKAEEWIREAKMNAMQDGLGKELFELEMERQRRINEIKSNGKKVEEATAAVEDEIAQRRKKIWENWQEQNRRTMREINNDITDSTTEQMRILADGLSEYADKILEDLNIANRIPLTNLNGLDDKDGFGMAVLGDMRNLINSMDTALDEDGLSEKIKELKENLEIFKDSYNFDPDEFKDAFSEMEDKTISLDERISKLNQTTMHFIREIGEQYPEQFKRLTDDLSITEFGWDEGKLADNMTILKNFVSEIEPTIISSVDKTVEEVIAIWNNELAVRKQILEAERKAAETTANREYQDRIKAINDENKLDNIDEEQKETVRKKREELREKALQAHNSRLAVINNQYEDDVIKATRDTTDKINKLYQTGFEKIEDTVSKALSRVRDELDDLPKTIQGGIFSGIVDVKGSSSKYKEAAAAVKETIDIIEKQMTEAEMRFKSGSLTQEAYNSTMEHLELLRKDAKTTLKDISNSLSELTPQLLKQINEIVNYTLNGVNDFMSALDSIAEARYQKQIDAIDKENELLEEKLSKQAEITQKYADKIDEIESELADSRGDRRQFLIDSINAQMEAERASLAQEREIEKQQEELDKKKEKLEIEERKRKKTAAIRQAVLNAIMAISNAAVNHYPIPAIPMIAMATAIGAAQVAAAKAAQYGDGGLLKGKSHKQGGIKVLGGAAEVEGGEYVTNKRTTAQNLPLLEFINERKRKVDLSDMMDFYGGKIKNNISTTRKRIFADGGELPSLRTDINLQNDVVSALEQYNNRDVVVSVVDIVNKTSDVNNVRVLSGLSPL